MNHDASLPVSSRSMRAADLSASDDCRRFTVRYAPLLTCRSWPRAGWDAREKRQTGFRQERRWALATDLHSVAEGDGQAVDARILQEVLAVLLGGAVL